MEARGCDVRLHGALHQSLVVEGVQRRPLDCSDPSTPSPRAKNRTNGWNFSGQPPAIVVTMTVGEARRLAAPTVQRGGTRARGPASKAAPGSEGPPGAFEFSRSSDQNL